MRNVFGRLPAMLLLACTACGSDDSVYPVSGRVTYKGTPAAGAAVFFHRQGADPGNGPTILGVVQADGSFEVVCGALGKGAPAGAYNVLLEWKRSTRQGGRPQTGADKLRGRYADPRHPRFQVIVKPERNELAPLELKD